MCLEHRVRKGTGYHKMKSGRSRNQAMEGLEVLGTCALLCPVGSKYMQKGVLREESLREVSNFEHYIWLLWKWIVEW